LCLGWCGWAPCAPLAASEVAGAAARERGRCGLGARDERTPEAVSAAQKSKHQCIHGENRAKAIVKEQEGS